MDVLRIEWSSGTVQELYNVPAKQYLTVTEPARLSIPSLGELHIQCWKGMACRIEGSPDLSAWTPLATVTNLTGKQEPPRGSAQGQAQRVEGQHVGGPVQEPQPVHLAARTAVDDLVALVDDIEKLFVHGNTIRQVGQVGVMS